MTKAERIFKNTYAMCKEGLKTWGFRNNPDGRPIGYSFVDCKDDESVSTRTCNDIQKFIDAEHTTLKMMNKYHTVDDDTLMRWKYALQMTQVTLDNTRKSIAM